MSTKSAPGAQGRVFLFAFVNDVSELSDYGECPLTCARFIVRRTTMPCTEAREIVRVASGPCRIIVPRNPMTPHIGRRTGARSFRRGGGGLPLNWRAARCRVLWNLCELTRTYFC
ncbi:hypothetical protein MRX96_015668 [Rhipicephalus microplus]